MGVRMRRRGRKGIRWNRRSIFGLGVVVVMLLLLSQVSNYFNFWVFGPNTGYRTASLSSGHYERRYPTILRDAPDIGRVFVPAGERLVVDYDLEVQDGEISFALWQWPILRYRPNDIGPGPISQNDQGQIRVTVDGPGLYRLYFHAHRWQGAISVDWWTEKQD